MGKLRLRPQIVAFIGLLALLFIGNVIITHNVFTKPFPGRNDFLSRWEGARSFFIEGFSPYSDEASLNIQRRIYGRPVATGEDPGFFVYPFYTAFLVWPTVYFDYAWADAIWMVALEACLITAVLLLLNLYRWRPAPWLMGILLFWSLGDYFAGRGLFLGQPSHIVYFLTVLSIWALYRQHDNLAGAALAVSTLKPQMDYLVIPLMLLWALRAGRRKIVAAFFITWGGLMLASFIAQPNWLGDWIDQVRLYPDYTAAAYPDTGSPVWIITQHYLGLGSVGEWAVNLCFIIPLLWAWYMLLIKGHHERLLWTICLTLVVTHLVALRTATPHFVVFNIAIVFYLRQIQRAWGNLVVVAVLAGLSLLSWAQFLMTVQGRNALEHPSLFLPLPLGMFAVLWLTRATWWQSSPPIQTMKPSAVIQETQPA